MKLKNGHSLVGRYIFFALVSVVVNLYLQYISLSIYDGRWGLYVAMIAGTSAGLLTKYALDKKWIFSHEAASRRDDIRMLLRYAFFGGVITGFYFALEIAFDHYLPWPSAKFVGAVLGLGIGYTAKYYLDKHYVFCRKKA